MAYPEHSKWPCELCRQWMFDPKTGKPIERRGERVKRPPGVRTPCESCPKKSPDKEKEFILTMENIETIKLYLRSRATGGACLTEREKMDPLLLRNFAIIDVQMRAAEADRATANMVQILLAAKS